MRDHGLRRLIRIRGKFLLLAGALLVLVTSALSVPLQIIPDASAQSPVVANTTIPPEGLEPRIPIYSGGTSVAIYQNYIPWFFNEEKNEKALEALGLLRGPDYAVRPMSALQTGIPSETQVIIIPSASRGDLLSMISDQIDPAAQANLDSFVRGGGVLVAHLGDNPSGAYRVPGLLGTADDATNCSGITIVDAAHPLVIGPDRLPGTSDDLDNDKIDAQKQPVPSAAGNPFPPGGTFCSDNHGSLAGILPADAVVVLREEGGLERPVWAEYSLGSGHVIVTTLTLEFIRHQFQTLVNEMDVALGLVGAVEEAVRVGESGCREFNFVNDETIAQMGSNIDWRRCGIIDNEPPDIIRAYVTPTDNVCVETLDNIRTATVSYNGAEIPRWAGQNNGTFCTTGPVPAIIKVVATDVAGNESEMVAINTTEIPRAQEVTPRTEEVTSRTEQGFSAVVSKKLNPHHGVEGIVLSSDDVLKQVRLARSPDFSNEGILHLSENAIKELSGEHTVVVNYKGRYVDREGQIYVFAANGGLLATFDVKVDSEDIRLSLHQEKPRHGTYDLVLKDPIAFDSLTSNAWQKAELERIFARNADLTTTQQRILNMVLMRVTTGSTDNGFAVIDEEQGFTIGIESELNPHHGVEGITLETNSPVKQIKLVSSDFSQRELYISEKEIQLLDGKKTIELIYKGGYGEERYGQIHVFAVNMGKIATFDVVIKDDIKLNLRQDGL
ncbi:MAG: hypothetical protein ACE5J2_04025 [Nitrososphaerales archaeon]